MMSDDCRSHGGEGVEQQRDEEGMNPNPQNAMTFSHPCQYQEAFGIIMKKNVKRIMLPCF